MVSPETRINDVDQEGRILSGGRAHYIIIDALVSAMINGISQAFGYRHTPVGYMLLEADERGWLWVEPLRIYVSVRAGRVVCFDEAGAELLNHQDRAGLVPWSAWHG